MQTITQQSAVASSPVEVEIGVHQGAASETPSSTSATPSAELVALASQIEAMLIASGRPTNPQRLGVALGLIAPEPDQVPAEAALATEGSASDAPAGESLPPESPKPRRRQRKAATDEISPTQRIADAIMWLNGQYESTGRSFRIEHVSGGYRMMTLPAFRAPIATLLGISAQTKLSRAAVETLAIIAYRQPVTRANLEAIRGVASGEILRTLLDRRLITIAGRAEELGRPLLYATSKGFLNAFGLGSLKDLPTPGELGFKAPQA